MNASPGRAGTHQVDDAGGRDWLVPGECRRLAGAEHLRFMFRDPATR